MTNETQQILKAALQLPKQERAFLAEKLLESLDTKANFVIFPEWKAEIIHRVEQIDKGEVELIPGDEKAFEALG